MNRQGKNNYDFSDLAHDCSMLHYVEWSGIRACGPWTLTRAESGRMKDGRLKGEIQADRMQGFLT